MVLSELVGYELGNRTISYVERDAILYALTVGASRLETDLVYERDLRVLPTYALDFGQLKQQVSWARMTVNYRCTLHNLWIYLCRCPNPETLRLPEKSTVYGTREKRRYWILKLSASTSGLRMEFFFLDSEVGVVNGLDHHVRVVIRSPQLRKLENPGPEIMPLLRNKLHFID